MPRVGVFPDTELSRRIRANFGRRRRPEFVNHFQAAVGYPPNEGDFADPPETDRLNTELRDRTIGQEPALTWPQSDEDGVFAHIRQLAERLDEEHSSYFVCFALSEYIGAVRVRSREVLTFAQSLWRGDRESFCLLTADLADGLVLHDSFNFPWDESELYAWGAFAQGDNP